MFLFELKQKLSKVPPDHTEGRFAFFRRPELDRLALPQTDRERIWPLFWEHRGGFFAAHCRCGAEGKNEWVVEESITAPK
jgi:8-oxo-dGTP diphosphatase